MEFKPNSAKVVEIETALDAFPVETGIGPGLWATVRIDYTMAGLSPHMDIRVPVSFEPGQRTPSVPVKLCETLDS